MHGVQSRFSQAVEPSKRELMGNRVRPKEIIGEALANDEEEGTAEEESEEGRAITGQKAIYKPHKNGTIT